MADSRPNNVAAQSGQPPPPRDAEANKPSTAKEEPKKIIRLLTVMAYMMSVSMAAFMLSAYYIFLWNPKEHRPSGPERFSDPCPECYLRGGGGMNEDHLNLPQPPAYNFNDSQIAETPMVLPAKEELPTTPLSRFAQDYLDLDLPKDNYSLPERVHS